MHTSAPRSWISSLVAALLLVCLLLLPWPAAASAAPITTAPSLPIGAWEIIANGYSGTLNIIAISSAGSVQGSAFGKPLKGWWDGVAQRLTFELGAAPTPAVQFYTGYLTVTTDGLSTKFRFSGFFEALGDGGGSAPRSTFGWTASTSTSAAVGMVEAPAVSSANTVLLQGDWTMYGPVCCAKLHLQSLDGAGNVTGVLIENASANKIQGFWDPGQKKLTVIRFSDLLDPTKLEVYTGYLIGAGTSLSLAGTVEILDDTAQHAVQGWYAVQLKCEVGFVCGPSGGLP